MSWQFDTDKLTALKAELNDMGTKVCRLETIRRVAPWQRAEIDRLAGVLR